MGPGTILNGRYRLIERLGGGAMGAVWRGCDLNIERDIAIKVLLERNPDPDAFERFRNEAKFAGRVEHPGITVVHDIGCHDSQPFIVMELLKGRDLRAILADNPAGLPVSEVMSLAVQVTGALGAAHGMGVVHRDLKPANLFVLTERQVKICDFGIAKALDATRTLTTPGSIIGTPAYMSPEQCNGGTVDARSDLYSLGCVLYELLTGHPPFPADQEFSALAYQHTNIIPPPPRTDHVIPESLSALVLQLLAKNPQDRPASAAAVTAELGRIDPARKTGTKLTSNPPAQLTDQARARRDAKRLRWRSAEGAANKLRAMSWAHAALTLESFDDVPKSIGRALSQLEPATIIAILLLVNKKRSGELLAVMDDTIAARTLELMDSRSAAGKLAQATPVRRAVAILLCMKPDLAAALLVAINESEPKTALELLDQLHGGSYLSIIEPLRHHPGATDLIINAEGNKRQATERVAPWTQSMRVSAWLLVLTTLVVDACVPLHLEPWEALFISIPAGMAGILGGFWASKERFTRRDIPVAGTFCFALAGIGSILLVIPGAAFAGPIIMACCAVWGTKYIKRRTQR